jgi:hypothetical protein
MLFSRLSKPATFWLITFVACAVLTVVVLAIAPNSAPFTPAAGARAAAAVVHGWGGTGP